MSRKDRGLAPPIIVRKAYREPSVFLPENLLREARRQKRVPEGAVPEVCVLDPDGDIVRHLRRAGAAQVCEAWACYHTELDEFTRDGQEFGIVGCAVGASFAVLVAEELFASGCAFLVSVTSAGQIVARGEPPYFVLIDRALRDEGTSYHYLPPSDYAGIDARVLAAMEGAFDDLAIAVHRGATWSTDAPFRETNEAIAFCKEQEIMAVEMEAAALYAFARARGRPVVCFAHVTNRMARTEGDFEKGTADGSADALAVIAAAARRWRAGES